MVFALVALFVGSYIIINTFSILIAQRTRELALLRALGATRGQVFRMVLAEALLTGFVASAIGVVAGLFLAHGLYSLVSSVGNGLPKADLVLQPSTVIIGGAWDGHHRRRFDPPGAQGQSRRSRRGDPRRHRRRAATG